MHLHLHAPCLAPHLFLLHDHGLAHGLALQHIQLALTGLRFVLDRGHFLRNDENTIKEKDLCLTVHIESPEGFSITRSGLLLPRLYVSGEITKEIDRGAPVTHRYPVGVGAHLLVL